MRLFKKLAPVVACTMLVFPAVASAATNVVPTNLASFTWPGGDGVLRNSNWSIGNTPSNAATVSDGVFAPNNQQWNNGSFWWDEAVTGSPFQAILTLNNIFNFSRIVLQGDNNEDYLVEYWTGSAWATAYTAGIVGTPGLQTRDSGTLASFTTDRFRLSATGGDKYYSISEFQAFGALPAVPEPSTWAMMIGGFGLVGATLRRRRRTSALAVA